jgi:hypothetical protein
MIAGSSQKVFPVSSKRAFFLANSPGDAGKLGATSEMGPGF